MEPQVPMEARDHSMMQPPGERPFLGYQQQQHLGAPLTSQLSPGHEALGCPDQGYQNQAGALPPPGHREGRLGGTLWPQAGLSPPNATPTPRLHRPHTARTTSPPPPPAHSPPPLPPPSPLLPPSLLLPSPPSPLLLPPFPSPLPLSSSPSLAMYFLSPPAGVVFGADDFLPCLTWVVLRSDVITLQLDTDYMMELLDPIQLQGEGEEGLTHTHTYTHTHIHTHTHV